MPCGICFGEEEVGKRILLLLPCSHLFCACCISKLDWISVTLSQSSIQCPTCRTNCLFQISSNLLNRTDMIMEQMIRLLPRFQESLRYNEIDAAITLKRISNQHLCVEKNCTQEAVWNCQECGNQCDSCNQLFHPAGLSNHVREKLDCIQERKKQKREEVAKQIAMEKRTQIREKKYQIEKELVEKQKAIRNVSTQFQEEYEEEKRVCQTLAKVEEKLKEVRQEFVSLQRLRIQTIKKNEEHLTVASKQLQLYLQELEDLEKKTDEQLAFCIEKEQIISKEIKDNWKEEKEKRKRKLQSLQTFLDRCLDV